ncbi:unnamed protein product [Prorocentrum cordatum]|uniref:RNA-directed RNA polymerase n=1 Tax=Prorocentrum cordatum TaxID=2364126 RepID=A0ABN9VB66_9DINO|nr:unnamed protein product [Polarella glacialis]
MTYSDTYPGKFLGLLAFDDIEQEAVLLDIQRDWRLLQSLEASDDEWAKHYLRQLRWPMEQWTREMFVMLYEESFKNVSKEAFDKLLGFANSWMSTLINEDLFNRYRARERAHQASVFGRVSRWHKATTTELIKEYDRKEILITPTSKSMKLVSVTPDFCRADISEFSLDPQLLDVFTDAAKEFPHLSGQGMLKRGMAWQSARKLQGDIAEMKFSWLSLCIEPGMYVMGQDAGTTDIHIVEPQSAKHNPSDMIFIMPINSIDGLKRIKVCKVMALSPLGAARHSAMIPSNGLAARLIIDNNKTENALKMAALRGLKELDSFWLPRLLSILKMRFTSASRPTNVKGMVTAIIREIIPGASDEVIDNALYCRGQVHETKGATSVLSDPENLEKIETGLDTDDMLVVKKAAEQVRAKVNYNKQQAKENSKDRVGKGGAGPGPPEASASNGGAAAAASSSASGGGAVPMELEAAAPAASTAPRAWTVHDDPAPDADVELAWARRFAPPFATLQKDAKRFQRWVGAYPKQLPPFSVSKSWGPKTTYTVKTALMFVLQTLWLWHEEETGEKCPCALWGDNAGLPP